MLIEWGTDLAALAQANIMPHKEYAQAFTQYTTLDGDNMLTKISPQDAHKKLIEGTARLIDIRMPDEFSQLSIEGSLLAPLPVVHLQKLKENHADGQELTENHAVQGSPAENSPQNPTQEKEVIFLCRSGNRTENAKETLQRLYPTAYILDGGIAAWQKAGLPLRVGKGPRLPIERQIFIAAGSMVLVGVAGSFAWPPLLFLAGFVGAGLVFSGISGFCGLGILLSKMPWNKG